MDERRENASVSFACVCGSLALCLSLLMCPHLSPSVHPFLSVVWAHNNGGKHLRLRGNYGRAKHSGQWRADELRHPTISPRISISPRSPSDQSVISAERQRGGEGRRDVKELRRTQVVGQDFTSRIMT